MQPLVIRSVRARQFLQQATGLDGAFPNVDAALQHLGYAQIDPINVSGRMQDHILRHRVRGYREHGLMAHLHADGPRTAFEHHLPGSQTLVALPVEAWPHLQLAMQTRTGSESSWSGKLSTAEEQLAAEILARMASEGPLSSLDVESHRKAKAHAWDATTLAKSTLQKLFFHGRVLVARRESNRRSYDLPERVLPAAILNAPSPTTTETTRWLALLKLRQHRLAVLKAAELKAVADDVMPVTVEDAETPRLHVLRSDAGWLEGASETRPKPLLIAPLDPIIYDRRVTDSVWGFDYRWEVYVPAEKRVRGYYALPFLHEHRFLGHVDAKADRNGGTLDIVSCEVSAGAPLQSAVASLADFLGLKVLNP